MFSYYCEEVNYNSNGICIESLSKLEYMTILTKLSSSNPWSWDAALVHLTRLFFLNCRYVFIWLDLFVGWSVSMFELVWFLFGGGGAQGLSTEQNNMAFSMLPSSARAWDPPTTASQVLALEVCTISPAT